MNFSRLTKLGTLTFLVLFTWTSGAFSGGGAAGSKGCWTVDNPSNGAIALRATIAVVFTPGDFSCDGSPNVDAVIRVQRGSDMAFFRTNIAEDIFQNTDEMIGNKLLNSCVYGLSNPSGAAADELADKILDHFIGTDRPGMELVITSKSVSNTDYNGNETEREILDTGRAASIADITLYAIVK